MRLRASIGLLLLPGLPACYVTTPLEHPSPSAGEVVVLQISDRGRVALSERLGSGVARIQGRVESASDDALALHVASVGYLSGQTNTWNGERVTIGRDYVAATRLRRFSRKRTWIAVGTTTAVVGAFIASHGLRTAVADLVNGPGDGTGGPQR